jgi:regulator of nucleoside diphosphate kinase
MLLDVRLIDLPVSDALREFTQRRVSRALRPFESKIIRVELRITDVNGPNGGIDKRCKATAELAGIKRKIVVEAEGADAYATVQDACARLGEAVSRSLGRRARLDRFGASPSTAAPPPAPTPVPPPSAQTDAAPDPEGRVTVTELDYDRLRKLIETRLDARDRDAVSALSDELDRTEVVPAESVTGTLVTMNSRVVFRDEETGETREVSLVYPGESDLERGRISVLAPVGSALLGLSVGQTIDWPLPRGQLKRIRVVKVVYQPEAAGDSHL